MLVNVSLWLIVGLVSGLLVYVVYPGNKRYFTGTIAAGVIGAFVGGVLFSALKIGAIAFSLDWMALVSALMGAIVLNLFIYLIIKNEPEGT